LSARGRGCHRLASNEDSYEGKQELGTHGCEQHK